MIIVNAEAGNYSPDARAILDTIGEVRAGDLDRACLLEACRDADVLIVRLRHRIDDEVMRQAPRLKAIVSATTGLDHIDLMTASARGISVLSLKGEAEFLQGVSATAEHAWALLLALVRKVPYAFESVRAGNWSRDQFRGNTLDGKSLGIVGLGRLGIKVARYGLAFGMTVAAYDPYRTDWPEGVSPVPTLADLLVRSDILSLHVPLDDTTINMIGAAELSLLPAGAVLVNTSRGRIVDEAALLDALESGRLRGAAVDVICDEVDRRNCGRSPLVAWACEHSNLLVTPHIGGATEEAMSRTEIFMANKLARFVKNNCQDQAQARTGCEQET